MHSIPRRRFLQAALGTVALGPVSALAREAANERLNVGVVGLGARGFHLLREFLSQGDVQVTAVCDVDRHHHRERPWGQGPALGREPARELVASAYASPKSGRPHRGVGVYADFRELCARDDLDAVVVATPDHWHALCTLTALRAGKDVYCEKPVTHLFHEGQLVYREVAARNAVFQTGSQQRSSAEFRRAVELVRNGHLGELRRVEVGLPPGYDVPQGDASPAEPPESLDYDFWCGPAPRLPYLRARHHRWWRGHRAFGGGVLMDWIGHHNDIAHWALGMDRLGPTRVEAVNWTFPETPVYDTPFQYEIHCEYPGGVTSVISSRLRLGTKLIGNDGWVFVTRGKLEASTAQWTRDDFSPGPKPVAKSAGHVRNFLDSVKSRQECIAPAETAHRSITPGHLGYVSQALGRPLQWDADRETVVDDAEANRLLQTVDYRAPWEMEG